MSPSSDSSGPPDGNDSTSVALSIPRNWRFSSRIFLSETKAIVADDSLLPIAASAFVPKVDHARVSICKRRWRLTTSIILLHLVSLGLFLVGANDHLHELVAH